MTPTKIALIIASTRTPRVAPEIAKYILTALTPTLPTNVTLTIVDLLDWTSLPLVSNGSTPPAHLAPDALKYDDISVQSWSDLIAAFSGYIFLTPQYNWSFPAGLKGALDVLFHEWGRKPAAVVSYGSHGGDKANAALRQVLRGLRMVVQWEGSVELALGKGLESAATVGKLDEGVVKAWDEGEKREELRVCLEGLVAVLGLSKEELVKGEMEAREKELKKRAELKALGY